MPSSVQEIREMIRQEAPARFDVGRVVAAPTRGTRWVGVVTSGTGATHRCRTCVDNLTPGDEVIVVYIERLDRMVVVARVESEFESTLSHVAILAPPDNLTVTPVPAGIDVRWDTWPGESICWQVRYNSSASDTDATDVLVTRGSYYLHRVVDASGDMDTAAAVYFKVRALRWLGPNNVVFSAWSAWGNATSGGHNLRELVEVELENAAELTIDGAGAITRTQVYHTVDTNGDAATDNLDTISGGTEGDILIIRPANGGRTVVVRHNQDNIWLIGAANISLDDADDHLMLVYDGSMWCDTGGGGGSGATTFLALTDTPAAYAGYADHIPAVDPTESFLQWVACAGWISISDVSDLAWQPDAVAILHNGRVYEYADPDSAFTSAVAGDVILIPPGTWTLDSNHTLSGVSVIGIAGGPEDCVLQSTVSPAPITALLRLNTSGVAKNFSIDWNVATANATRMGLWISSGCAAYYCKVDVDVVGGVGSAVGIYQEGYARRCVGDAYSVGGNAYGFLATAGSTTMDCEGYAEIGGPDWATGFTIPSAPESAPIRGCLGIATRGASGTAWGLRFGTDGDVHAAHCYFNGTDADVRGDTTNAYFYSVRAETESLVNGATITHSGGDRAGKYRNETITGEWTFGADINLSSGAGIDAVGELRIRVDGTDKVGITPVGTWIADAMSIGFGTASTSLELPDDGGLAVAGPLYQPEQASDPASATGAARLYPKDDGGQTKYYYRDDNGRTFELNGVLEDVTITVGAAGKDFTTLQGAVDWCKNWLIKGTCVIQEDDAGTYDEAVEFAGLLIAPGATLTLQGDTRALVGITYVDTSADATDMMNQGNIANGGDGVCTLSTNVGLDEITVSGSTTDPDFVTAGIVSGDRVIVFADDGNIYERVVSSANPGGAGNNVIGITVALPGGASLGNDGTAVGLLPNRAIENTSGATCIYINAVKGVEADGWYLESSGSSAHVANGGLGRFTNILSRSGTGGFLSYPGYATLFATGGACSAWDSTYYGFYAAQASQVDCRQAVAVDCGYGFYSTYYSWMYAPNALGTKCGVRAFQASIFSSLFGNACCARQSLVGYYAGQRGYVYATNTSAANNGNTTDYSPAASDAWGNNNGSITWT